MKIPSSWLVFHFTSIFLIMSCKNEGKANINTDSISEYVEFWLSDQSKSKIFQNKRLV